jgi:hypothetical protein
MILKRIFFICLLIGTLILFVLSAITLQVLSEDHSGIINLPGIAYYFQVSIYSFFVILLFLSNIMYFNLGKTIYLLITLLIFLLFLDFYWIFIKLAYYKGGFFSLVAIFLVILNYYILRNYFKPVNDKKV